MGRRTLLRVGLLAGFLCAAPLAHAEPDAEALIARGLELREGGRDAEALVVFRRALEKAPSARARAQVALAEQALGMWVVAEEDLVAALADQRDPWIAKNRAALEGALGVVRKRLTTLEVRGAEQGEVLVDGVRIGSGTGPFRVEAGRRSLEVRAPGFQPTTRWVELPPGGVARETVQLVAVPAPAPASAPEDPEPPRPPAEGSGQRLLGWAFAGTGAALLATGGVALLVREITIQDYNDQCPGRGLAQSPSCQDRIDASQTWSTVSMVTLISGGVFGAVGAVLLLTAPSPSTARASAGSSGRFGCAPSGAFVTCAGTF